ECSPRTWGWTGVSGSPVRRSTMLPTHVGMDRTPRCVTHPGGDAPHARGDGPPLVDVPSVESGCSPRTWGWTQSVDRARRKTSMLPTHVGMDRESKEASGVVLDAPHARGDGPIGPATGWARSACSPRTWGWTDSPVESAQTHA